MMSRVAVKIGTMWWSVGIGNDVRLLNRSLWPWVYFA